MSINLPPFPATTPLNQGSSLKVLAPGSIRLTYDSPNSQKIAEDFVQTPDMGLFTRPFIQWFEKLRQMINIVGEWITGTAIDGSFVEDPAWTDWTPTIAAGAATAVTNTLVARYMPHGKSVSFYVDWHGQLTGASVFSITFTPPVNNKAGGAQTLACIIYDGTDQFPGYCYADSASFFFVAQRPTANGNFPTSTNLVVAFSGTYEAA